MGPGRVNIIFVRGTVQTCLPFLRSLIDVTNLPLRLVANGCGTYEERLLARTCDESDRLEFHSLNSARTIEHGLALDYLLKIEKSELFTFMDSDIFATAPVSMSDIEPLPGEVACTGCLPVWHSDDDVRMPESFQVMGGRYVSSRSGHFLGCTYLASYRTRPLRELTASMGLSFRRYVRKDLPSDILVKLADLSLTKQVYDTAKVINLILQHQGHEMSFRNIEGLVHVGGVSGPVSKRDFDPTGLKRAIKFVMPSRLLKLINKHRYRCDQIEINDIANLNERRNQACELIAELGNGPPYSAKTKALMQHEDYVQDLARLFTAYKADFEHIGGRHKDGLLDMRQAAKNSE
jgi:hypothetical protein